MEQHKRRHLRFSRVKSSRRCSSILSALQLAGILLVVFGAIVVSYAQTTDLHPDREQGVLLYRQGNLPEALNSLRQATKAFKEDYLAWHYLGLAQYDSGDVKAARKSFERAIKLRPDFASSHTSLAYTLLVSGKLKEAEREAKLALSLDGSDARAHFVLGTIMLRENECQTALVHAEAAQANESKLAAPYLLKSQALLCQQVASFVRPTRVEGNVPTSQPEPTREERLENAKRQANKFREAADNLETYLKLEPNGVESSLWREQLKTLRVYAEPVEKPVNERTVFTGAEVTTKARVLAKPEPQYTEAARRAQVVGTVVLRVVFAADGAVKHLLIINSLPYGLTQQAIAAARKIKFIPAMRNGQPASTYIQLEYNFNLY